MIDNKAMKILAHLILKMEERALQEKYPRSIGKVANLKTYDIEITSNAYEDIP